ncbi:hypothetical protein GOODEAATRI_034342 [Goodea atripinnis]|uniref:Uncharacterized protein n=1 Tax=Goodea atripinnis TaxID=208336 RepID=A0ABV0PA05_9TELE
MLQFFYKSFVWSVISSAIICWCSRIRARNLKKLNKLIKKAGSVLGTHLEIVEAVFASPGLLIWVQVSKSEINTSTINLCSPLRRVRDGAQPSTCKPNSATLWFQLVLFSLKGVFDIYIYHVTHVYNIAFP